MTKKRKPLAFGRDPRCTRCQLSQSASHPCVWGNGPKPCDLMIVGEAPGFEEDYKGVPFVGQAGKLLDHVLNKLGQPRDKVYVTNVLKCRPHANKLPKRSDVMVCWAVCKMYLDHEIWEVKPKVIVVMGSTATSLLTGDCTPITRIDGSVVASEYENVHVVACLHPAYALRSPSKEVRIASALAYAMKLAGMAHAVIQPDTYERYRIYPYRGNN